MTVLRTSYLTRVAVAACVAVAALSAGALAQPGTRTQTTQTSTPDSGALTPVVVTATKVPIAESVPTASTTVITGEDLRARYVIRA